VAGFVAERIENAVTSAGPELLRPPGALDELAFLTACTRCDKCLRACPQESILRAPAGSGFSVGTPYIHPRSMPCFLCAELPCIPACPEGALVWPKRWIGAREFGGPEAVKMGTARIRESLCWTYPVADREAEDCRVCVDRCPFPGGAIRMEGDDRAHPKVDGDRCTGCGLCVFVCPATGPAIAVAPRR
jgi:MauM/NapG family ferredoxin protein